MAQPQARRFSFLPRRSEPVDPEPQPITSTLPKLWKAMVLTSFIMNIVLLTVVLLLVGFVFSWRTQLFGAGVGLHGFAVGEVAELRDVVGQLQSAHIRTTIPLEQPLPLQGAGVVVPVDQVTTVTLQEPVPLSLAGADIDLGGGNRLRASNINLVLPQGTPLKIALKMDIPLDNVTIPIKLDVPVDIAMKDTELAPQFRRLGQVVDRLVYPIAPFLGLDVPQPDPLPAQK